ncbi:MAG: hypothetical protein NVS9B7_15890 [Flavisolibacter sp.]
MQVSATKIWESVWFPELKEFDGLIIMGGPMNVYDEVLYPWLQMEKQLILASIKANKSVLGICLGAQLIANVLGSKIFKIQHKELGWFPIEIKDSLNQWLHSQIQSPMEVFHWHSDSFDLPQGAINHAGSKACDHQLFTTSGRVVGIQFHLEVLPETLSLMLLGENAPWKKEQYVQTIAEILHHPKEKKYQLSHFLLRNILNRIFLAHLLKP